MTLEVVIAEDSVLMREGIMSVLALHDEVKIAEVCVDFDELVTAVDRHNPDVVVTDIRMPPSQTDEGIRAAKGFRETHPDMGVVVLSQYVEPDYALQLLEAGTHGRAYLLKERVADPDELAAAIHRVHEGGSVIDPQVVDALITARTGDSPTILDRLTKRETEVVSHMAQGQSNAAIGAALFISPRSVEKHINSIFMKLELTQEPDSNRRVQAVLVYLSEIGN